MRAPTDRPNIILINCDDLGWGDLGCYGSTVNCTPAVDRLAAEGLRLTDFYQAASVCTPSRAALMTGCYPPRVGMAIADHGQWVLFPGHGRGLNPAEKTIATVLKEVGYATGVVGKWHLGDQPEFLPTRHGFDQYYGLPYSNDMGRMRGREDYPPLPLLRGEEVVQQQPDQTTLTERYVEESVRFVRAQRDRPFFLYFAHLWVHLPLLVPECFRVGSRNGAYGAAVACIDWALAALLHELDVLGLARNTIVVLTSDNGSNGKHGGSNGPLRGKKGQTWEGGMRLPCIVRWPGQIPAGSVSRELCTAMDLLPTFALAAGTCAPTDRTIDGRSILDLWRAPARTGTPHDAFAYYFKEELQAVRRGQWKLHVRSGELYDLAADVSETTDRRAQAPEVVAELERYAAGFRADLGDTATGVVGRGCRPPGQVADPRPLTAYDPAHPYVVALYDIDNGIG